MSDIGNNTAATIVETDTLALIERADNIIRSCTGTNCNVSEATRTTITQQLSLLAQDQAKSTLILLSIPLSSVFGRNIVNSYMNLGAAVASVYNFQCGNNTVNSTRCVTNASSVQAAQNNLQFLLVQPAENEFHHVIVLSILLIIAIIAFILFFIFLIIGLIEKMLEAHQVQYIVTTQEPAQLHIIQPTVQPTIQVNTTTPTTQKIAVPVSPFQTTEPVYQ
jgi:hypothetical protein